MTVQAQNALLKTIEEPPEYAIIILLTTNADMFLQTILSRCVLLNIRPVKEETIRYHLMSEFGIGNYEANVAAVFANGNPGKAIKLATSEDFKELKQQVVGTLLSLEKGGMDIITQRVKEAGSFKNQIDDKIIFDSFFTTLQVKDIIDSDVTITVDTQWSLDGVSPYLEKLEEIYNTLTSGHYQLHLETEDEYNKSIQQKNDLMLFNDNLNSDLKFENFVVGNSNRIAQKAS